MTKPRPLSDRFMGIWRHKVHTMSARTIAQTIDRKHRRVKNPDSGNTSYHFSDGSIIVTHGRGRNWYCHNLSWRPIK